ncbi:MAG TPA: ATP-grasp domain-containing protein [Candidatus Aquabacterium excrementipullorum]|nr:ATP-grasp domain-containing protein [Candidatus Aquabacterium excrementipullorum]
MIALPWGMKGAATWSKSHPGCRRLFDKDMPLKLAFVQAPTAAQLADARAAASRGEREPFFDDLHAVREELRRRGVEVRSTYSGQPLPLLKGLTAADIFAFGSLMTMSRWLQRFNWQALQAPSYPRALDHVLNRRTWRGSLASLQGGPMAQYKPVFAKPSRPCFSGGDRLDGRVWPSLDALAEAHPDLSQESFFCSEVVGWVSEYRCYVMHGRVLGIHPYQLLGRHCGRVDAAQLECHVPDMRPDVVFVEQAIRQLEASGESLDGYALDFGLMARGRMSLVELNDAISLTNYGLAVQDHVDLHLARWQQMARNACPP